MRNGIGLAAELDVMVGVNGCLFPLRQFEPFGRKSFQSRPFSFNEDCPWLFASCSMLPEAVIVRRPLLQQAVELGECGAGVLNDDHASGLTDGLYVAFDLAFILWMTDSCRVDEAAVMLAHLAIGPVQVRIVKIWL